MRILKIIRNLAVGMLLTVFVCLAGVLVLLKTGAWADIRSSMVMITTVYDAPSYINPWNFIGCSTKSGSGCVIAGNLILTNAHIVSHQTYIDVQRYGDPEKYKASVKAVSHQADLALLQVDDPTFFAGVPPLEFGDLPEARQEVTVFGYPAGGDTLSTTRGVVSRIEHRQYAHSARNLLAIQIDAAINSGNSGGPALIDNKIVGVVMQCLPESEGIGYIVPTPVIRHFLKDIEDGLFDGIPEDGIIVQSLENRELKEYYRMKEDMTGCLVRYVVPGFPAEGIVQADDVILAVDGHPIANNGTVEFRENDRTSADYYTQMHQIGETVVMDILRNGQPVTCQIPLIKTQRSLKLVPDMQYDVLPTYYIYGGLLFIPLTTNYVTAFGDNWSSDLASLADIAATLNDLPGSGGEEVVLLSYVMPHNVNRGYHNYADYIISEVNGQKVRNLKHLIQILRDNEKSPYVKFIAGNKQTIVLSPSKAAEAMPEIMKTYNIPADRSKDLL